MSKPLTDDPDLPPGPEPLDYDLPPEPREPSVPSGLAPSSALAEELLGSAEQAAAPSLRAEGDVLTVGGARYHVVRRLGVGGMGEVYLARKQGSSGFERDVALKTVLPALSGHRRAATFLKGFVDEARLAALLTHPNICQVYDLQPLEGRGLIQVLEFIPGHSLKEVIETARRKRASLTEPFACFVAGEIASALEYAHAATSSAGQPLGIVHRDVTPHNIMVAASGTVKLLDFGIAFSALENREVTTASMVKGKDQFYSPEQLVGSALDGRSDEFALALCLYELLCLKRFFVRSALDTETQLHLRIAQLTPEVVGATLEAASIEPSLKDILHHALAPNRDERFRTCGEFGDALRIFSQHRGWLFTAVDAKRELEALFALPDASDSETTNPSGKRGAVSALPRKVPASTVSLPPLTPGRTASTPAAAGASVVESSTPKAGTPTPQRKLEREFFAASAATEAPVEPDDDSLSRVKPSVSAQKRRTQLQEELHNPKGSTKKMLAVPAAILLATLLVGILLVKFLLMTSTRAPAEAEIIKTPAQLSAEREAAERSGGNSAPPQLAPAPLPEVQPTAVAPAAVAVDAPPPRPKSRAPAGADAKAVDALLAKHYGGRPVVTPDAPGGEVAPAAPSGPRRRNLDTVMIGELSGSSGTAGTIHLPKGTTMMARLTAPADASQPAPVSAVVVADVVIAGTKVVPKGSTLVCMTAPAGARLGLNCDTLNVGRTVVTLDAIAMGSDKRVGLALPRVASVESGGPGDAVKDGALSLGRQLLGRATPDGVAGDLINGTGDTASNVARSGGRNQGEQSGPGVLISSGTPFVLFLQNPTN